MEGMARISRSSHTSLLSAELSRIQLSSGYATDISSCLSSAQGTHSHTGPSDGPRPHHVCCVCEVKVAEQGEGSPPLPFSPFHSAAQPSEHCKCPLLPSELHPSANRNSPCGFLLPVVIQVWLLTWFLYLCDTSKCSSLPHTQAQLRPVII